MSVYLDYNATTPVDPRVLDAMLPYFCEHFGNAASRQHAFGWKAQDAVDRARRRIAALIGADTREIAFTSGATESDNLALKGVARASRLKGDHIITLVTEHKAVLSLGRFTTADEIGYAAGKVSAVVTHLRQHPPAFELDTDENSQVADGTAGPDL